MKSWNISELGGSIRSNSEACSFFVVGALYITFVLVNQTTSQSRTTQMGSKTGHNKGVTIDQAIAICCACGRHLFGPLNYQSRETFVPDVKV